MSCEIIKVVKIGEREVATGSSSCRIIGNLSLVNLDPFVIVDEFKLKKPGEFSDHPHRGFESVTYMLAGTIQHEDSLGHNSVINAGDVQCMTAGRGILHSEKPIGKRMGHGLNVWLNLPKKYKMVAPAYQTLLDKDIPRTTKDGVTLKIIAGESSGIMTPMLTRSSSLFLEFKLEKGANLTQAIPEKWNGIVYILSGSALFGPEDIATVGLAHQVLVIGSGESLYAKNNGDGVCHFVLIAGKPHLEPIVHNGFFVMNERHELFKAIEDCRLSRNGFERAGEWKSSVTKMKYMYSRLPFL